MAQLVPCTSCRRHVRADGGACPFCSAAIADVRAIPGTSRRLPRGAVFAFASTMAIAGCSSSDDDGGVVPMYGAPADTGAMTDAKPDTGVAGDASDAGEDMGGGMALYGGAPVDSGSSD